MPEIWRGKPRTQVIFLFFGIRVKIIFSNMCIDVYTTPIARCLQQFTKFDADISKTEARKRANLCDLFLMYAAYYL